MNVLTVIAHPNRASFNFAMLERLERGLKSAGHVLRRRDLYSPLFDPVLRASELAGLQQGKVAGNVRDEQALLRWADGLVFIYPLWWLDRPAVLKGWCDRVLTHGFAFAYDENGARGLLTGKKAMVLITAGATEQEVRAMGGDSQRILFPMTRGSLKFCGIDDVIGRVYYAVGTISDPSRQEILDEVERLGERF